ncbi:MAG TPA: F0F1 ATP synthase subunit delta [Steroidobacteraceae bacterium]|jgi:F-type H+-transporting ATPase subunit delta
MAELATAARPYARAAFGSAGSGLPAWSTFLQRAAAVVQDSRVLPLIGNPRVPVSELVQFLAQIAIEGPGTSEQSVEQRNFLQLLADNRRLKLLSAIALQFDALRAESERIANVEVVSARALTGEQSKQLQQALERRLKLTVRLHPQVDQSLLGGAIVRYGDFVVDGSLRGRIDRLGTAVGGV